MTFFRSKFKKFYWDSKSKRTYQKSIKNIIIKSTY